MWLIFIYVERYPSEAHTTKKKIWFSFINLFYLFIYAHTHVCLCVYVCAHRCAVSYLKRPEEGAISLGAEVSVIHEPHGVYAALWLSPTLVGHYWASPRHLSPSSIFSSETYLSPTTPESLLWGDTCLFFPLFFRTLFPSFQRTTYLKTKIFGFACGNFHQQM